MKKYLGYLLAAVLIFSGSVASADATTITGTATETMQQSQQQVTSDIVQIEENLSEMGISEETRKKLIDKLNRGEVWDSNNPEKTKDLELKLDGKNKVKKVKFEDGSEVHMSLTGGNSRCGTGYCIYTDVKVEYDNGMLEAAYYANYTVTSGGGSNISNVYDEFINGVGSFSNVTLTIPIPKQTSAAAAQAQLKFYYTSPFGTTNTCYLKLYVSNYAWSEAIGF